MVVGRILGLFSFKSVLQLAACAAIALVYSLHAHSDELQPSPEENKPWTYQWKSRIGGFGVSDEIEESRVAGVSLLGSVHREFNRYVRFGAGAGARLETGSTHSLYEINRVQNGLWLDEAYVAVEPFPDYLSLTAGALNQRVYRNPLLVDELSFPGVEEQLGFKTESFKTALVFRQSIPTSQSLSTRTVEREPLPSLMTSGLTFSWDITDRVGTQLWAHHFRFRDLPSQVALASVSQGNIVEANQPETARFLYDFAGYTYGGDVGVRVHPDWKFTVGGSLLENTEAPERFARGLLGFGKLDWNLNQTWALSPQVEYFRNERHSSPAFYNSADYGHNNRHGMSYELKLVNQKRGLAVKGRYTDAHLIEEDPLQANSKIFIVYLEIFDGF